MSIATFAQVIPMNHHEIPLEDGERFKISSNRAHGLFLYDLYQTSENIYLSIVHLDTALQQKWKGSLKMPIEKSAALAGQVQQEENIYFLFRLKERSKFKIVKINLIDKNCQVYALENFTLVNQSIFNVTPKAALIGGYYNRIPIVLYFDLETLKQRSLQGSFKAKDKLIQVSVYQNGTFDILTKNKGEYARARDLSVKRYTSTGEFVKSFVLPSEAPKVMRYNNTVKTSDSLHVVTGLYGLPGSRFVDGIFTTALTADGQQLPSRFQAFKDMDSFSGYKNILKREPRPNFKLHTDFAIQGIIAGQDRYFMIGQAGYPKYSTPDYNYLGKRLSSKDRRRHRYFVIISFDNYGNIIWDKAVNLPSVQNLGISVQHGKVVLSYSSRGAMRSIVLDSKKTREGPSLDFASLQNQGYESLNRAPNKITYWYDNFFIVYKQGGFFVDGPSPGKFLFKKALIIDKVRLVAD